MIKALQHWYIIQWIALNHWVQWSLSRLCAELQEQYKILGGEERLDHKELDPQQELILDHLTTEETAILESVSKYETFTYEITYLDAGKHAHIY